MATKRTSTKTQAARKTKTKRASKRPSKAPPKRAAKARKASASKRPSKGPAKAAKATNGAPTNGASKKAKPARKRPSKAPAQSGAKRTTRPAKVGAVAKSHEVAPRPAPIPDVVTVTAPVPEDWAARAQSPGASRTSASHRRSRDSYLDEMPRDHAELLAGFLRVVKTAAGDIRKLILQAIALSNQRRDRFDR